VTTENLQEKDGLLVGMIDEAGTGGSTAQVSGYLARPQDGQAYPGVLLIQEWWGIDGHVKDLTERMAREGYVVLAPDLYHGRVVHEPDEAQKEMMALDMPRAVSEIGSALDYLLQSRDDVEPKRVGVVGFCMGGTLTWRTAEAQDGKVAAIAPFYAVGYRPTPEDIRKVTAPALILWGTKDDSTPADGRAHIVDLLRTEGKTFEYREYDAGHAFMNPEHGALVPDAAKEAWDELTAWFRRYVKEQ